MDYASAEHAKRVALSKLEVAWPSNEAGPFHEGELALQEALGVKESMDGFARKVVRRYMPPVHMQFYGELPFLVCGAVDEAGRPWCFWMVGAAGFVQATDNVTLEVRPARVIPESARSYLKPGARIGVLGIMMEVRRRNRLNATVLSDDGTTLRLGCDQSFGNCPQYISRREAVFVSPHTRGVDPSPRETKFEVDEAKGLGAREKALIEKSDTFFVASAAPGEGANLGADASHRGGKPGFVKVDGARLTVPDFPGNNHYNTYGNFKAYPKAGVFFVDFSTGAVLSAVGTVEKVGLFKSDDALTEAFAGAERSWTVKLESAVWLEPGAVPLTFAQKGGDDFASANSKLTGSWEDAEKTVRAKLKATEWRPYRVTDVIDEAKDIKSFYLEPADGDGLAEFQAGQYLTVRVPGTDKKKKKPLIRTYTCSSAPSEGYYRISVKKESNASVAIHETVRPGSVLDMVAPRGDFFIQAGDRSAKPAVLLAGGIGVTPMISMLRHLVREGLRTRWHVRRVFFVHVSRDENSRAFYRESLDLASRADPDYVKVVSLLSSVDGRLTKKTLQAILPLDSYEFFVCGPSGFTQATYDLLINDLGVPDSSVRAEAFGPAALARKPDPLYTQPTQIQQQPPAAETPQLVKFVKSGFETRWHPGLDANQAASGTLLDLAEAHGLTPEYGCRMGSCGTCQTKILKGKVTYAGRKPPLVDIEDACLICQAVPVDQDVLELDL